eukprot:Skav208330  [mRNA]  locus=scaffold1961:163511:164533:+ [translate_table: standard]
MACNRIQGEQTVPRAELLALEVATRLPGNIHTYSDSQYSLDVIAKLRDGTFDFLHGKDCDVARRLQTQLSQHHAFHKIKAHQDPMGIADLLQVYHSLGNKLADEVAKSASDPSLGDFSSALCTRHFQQQEYRDHLLAHYSYTVKLHKECKAWEVNHNVLQLREEQLECAQDLQALHVLQRYSPLNGLVFHAGDRLDAICHYFPWGAEIATLLSSWYSLFQWPSGDVLPKPCRNGVTCLELGLSFSYHLSSALPIVRETANGEKQMLKISSSFDCAAHGVTLHDFSFCMQTMLGHFTYVLTDDQLPGAQRGKNAALMYLGYEGHAAGLLTYPAVFANCVEG